MWETVNNQYGGRRVVMLGIGMGMRGMRRIRVGMQGIRVGMRGE